MEINHPASRLADPFFDLLATLRDTQSMRIDAAQHPSTGSNNPGGKSDEFRIIAIGLDAGVDLNIGVNKPRPQTDNPDALLGDFVAKPHDQRIEAGLGATIGRFGMDWRAFILR